MHPSLKILAGALIIALGVYSTITFYEELLLVGKGIIGVLLIIIGAFIVWLESDEWKLRKTQEEQKMEKSEIQKRFTPKTAVKEKDEEETEEEIEEKHACPDCGKEFDTKRGMNIHRAQKHSD